MPIDLGQFKKKEVESEDKNKVPKVTPAKLERKKIQDKKDAAPQLSKLKMAVKQTDINISSLITALNYAVNTIKNKKAVKDKEITSTYYQYYLEWNKLREYLMKQQGLI